MRKETLEPESENQDEETMKSNEESSECESEIIEVLLTSMKETPPYLKQLWEAISPPISERDLLKE